MAGCPRLARVPEEIDACTQPTLLPEVVGPGPGRRSAWRRAPWCARRTPRRSGAAQEDAGGRLPARRLRRPQHRGPLRRRPSTAASGPTIAIPAPRGGGRDAALDLDGFFGLHPALEPLLPLWKEGSLAAVHAVGQPRRHALALRRAGLHGERHARPQVHRRRLDEPPPAVAHPSPRPRPSARVVADARRCPARCRAARPRSPWPSLAQLRPAAAPQAPPRAASRTCTRRRRRTSLHGTGQETFEAIAVPEEGRSRALPRPPRARLPARPLRREPPADRAAHQGRRRRRGRVHRDRRLGPPRRRGRRAGPARPAAARARAGAGRVPAATSATACRTSWW